MLCHVVLGPAEPAHQEQAETITRAASIIRLGMNGASFVQSRGGFSAGGGTRTIHGGGRVGGSVVGEVPVVIGL